jgi:hypothetical protein
MPAYERNGVVVRFPDAAVGLSVSGLLSNRGVFHVKVSPGASGELFALLSPDYRIQLLIENNTVRFRRNEFVAEKAVGRVRRHFQVLVSWKPDQMQVAVMVDDDVGGDDACATVATPPLYVPVQLVDWSRRFNLSHRSNYSSPAEFMGVLLESIRQAHRNIRTSDSVKLFWDRQRQREAEHRLVPKREPEAMAGIAGFLQDQSLVGGYQLIQESKVGPGSLDLRAVACLQSGGLTTICIEGKNAHSEDLQHGITDQLPAYMEGARADFGVYLVLWYRCDQFAEPPQSDIDLTWSLTKLRPWETIAVEKFDLGLSAAPSDSAFHYA